nr:hypothetical protein Iba_chr12fCG11760 [Ipomoea batatas]
MAQQHLHRSSIFSSGVPVTVRMEDLIFGGTSIDFLSLNFILESTNFTPLPQLVRAERSQMITLKDLVGADHMSARHPKPTKVSTSSASIP